MNAVAERLADFLTSEKQPLPDVAHFPYVNDCQTILASSEPFTPDEKARFSRNLLILSNQKHEGLYPSKLGRISGQDYQEIFWEFSVVDKSYRNGWSLEFRQEDVDRELVLGKDGNTMHNTWREEGVRPWSEEVDDATAKRWLGKALEVSLRNKEVNSRIRFGRAQYQQSWNTRYRK